MDISLYDYDLPEELIAQRPAARRDLSRLLVLHDGDIDHKRFSDITGYIRDGDVVVFNDSKVIKARLAGVKESTGAGIELLLLSRVETDESSEDKSHEVWETLAKPAKRLKVGDRVLFGRNSVDCADVKNQRENNLFCEVLEKKESGSLIVRFEYRGIFLEVLDELGKIPLPPYIRRDADESDDDRYQTVYSKVPGSVAAPTAGLHFTDDLLAEIKAKGAEIVFVTLHVGLGTFRPVKTERIENHQMHVESYHISEEAAKIINAAKREGRRVVCVGTTAVRTLESAARGVGEDVVASGSGATDIFIYPGFHFNVCEALITNFHLPKSTLLMLVSALAGRENILTAYEEAIREGYRFFSYGDAMFLY